MKDDLLLRWVLALYTALMSLFVFAPIAASLVFSFNSDRFPTIPLGSFTTDWYVKAFSNPEVWDAALRSLSEDLVLEAQQDPDLERRHVDVVERAQRRDGALPTAAQHPPAVWQAKDVRERIRGQCAQNHRALLQRAFLADVLAHGRQQYAAQDG